MRRNYLGEEFDGVVGGGVGVVKRRHVGGYRGSVVARRLSGRLTAFRPPLGAPRPPRARARPLPCPRIGAWEFDMVDVVCTVWRV